jgi:magnesium transporter
MPAKDALRTLREQLKLPAFINFIQMVYVVDDATGRRLKGVMSLRDLLISEENKNLVDCMNPYTITIKPLERALQAATRVIDSELTALPVVGENGHLLGVVTIDAALLLVTPPAWSGREAPKLFS